MTDLPLPNKSGSKLRQRRLIEKGSNMTRGRHKKMLMLIPILLVAVFAEPDPDDLYRGFPKYRDEDKCYDDSGKPQVRAHFVNILFIIFVK